MTAKKNATLQNISATEFEQSFNHYSTCSRDTEMFCQAWFL